MAHQERHSVDLDGCGTNCIGLSHIINLRESRELSRTIKYQMKLLDTMVSMSVIPEVGSPSERRYISAS